MIADQQPVRIMGIRGDPAHVRRTETIVDRDRRDQRLKTIWAVVAFLVSWAGLHAYLRRRDVDLQRVWLITLALLALGLLGTFSPFFELFAPAE